MNAFKGSVQSAGWLPVQRVLTLLLRWPVWVRHCGKPWRASPVYLEILMIAETSMNRCASV